MLDNYSTQTDPQDQSPLKKTVFDGLKPKTAFFVGLFGGILVICTIGFFILLATMLDNETGDSDNNKVGVNNAVVKNVNQDQPETGTPAPITDDDYVRGNKDAQVVLIEYSDYQCPFCQQHHTTMKKIVDEFGDQVAWVYRHLPLTQLHPLANKASLAAECAGEQGKFWEYTDKLYENQSSITNEYFGQLAGDLSLNSSQFNDCLSSNKYQAKINNNSSDAGQAGARGTPATFINGELVAGAVPYEQFKGFIESLLP